jgi:hypothetical protein
MHCVIVHVNDAYVKSFFRSKMQKFKLIKLSSLGGSTAVECLPRQHKLVGSSLAVAVAAAVVAAAHAGGRHQGILKGEVSLYH